MCIFQIKLAPRLFGVYQLIMSVYLFTITLANSGIHLATTRIVSEQQAFRNANWDEKGDEKMFML